MSKHRSVVFTLHNYTNADLERINELYTRGRVEYVRYQQELCPTTGTPHLQGWAQARSPRTFSAWKNIIGGDDIRASVRARQGSVESNETYCSKPECRVPGTESVFFGVLPQQGTRTDLAAITEAALDLSVSWGTVALTDPTEFVKIHRGLKELRLSQLGPRDFQTRCFWFYGDTGCGKSRLANHVAPASQSYWKSGINKWFDGYCPIEHPDVIIDDFRANMCEFSFLLRLTDRYPCVVENKGSYYPFRAQRIFFTTPKPIKETWSTISNENLEQFERRVVSVCHFVSHGGRLYIRVVRGGDAPELQALPEWIEPFSNLDEATQSQLMRREEERLSGGSRAAGFNPGRVDDERDFYGF